MPASTNYAHRVISSTNLPYITNRNVTDTDPCYISGSTDILTNINGYASRRPGFSDSVEPTPTIFHNLQRTFVFERNDGNIYVIFCDIDAANKPHAYKMQVGKDASAISIFTGIVGNMPFDFVQSNNTLYFGNGVQMQKWDPLNGVSNWGISMGSQASAVTAYAGLAADGGNGFNVWANPTNAEGAPDGSGATSATLTNTLILTTYGFSIASANKINGIVVDVTCFVDIPSGYMTAQLTVNGSPIGDVKSFNPVVGGIGIDITVGDSSDLWGISWTALNINSTTFGVQFQGFTNDGSIANFNVDAAKISIFSSGAPAVTLVAGTLVASVGFQYVITYGNSNTGHMSSPSAYSAVVKPATNGVQITLVASTDPQVNLIHVFRTTDSATGLGGQSYFEIPTSPYANANANVTDNAIDGNLNVSSIAPTPTFNDPPPPSYGFVYFQGRIWMIDAVNPNKIWFTGLEEIINGVPEESVPSGVSGNFWAFSQTVKGLGVAGISSGQVLGVFTGGTISAITGTTLDTFRRSLISNRRGCHNRTCITMIGGMCAWLDSANQVWATDGNSLQELSIPIRPDLTGINQANCSMTFHTGKNFHWLVLSTGTKLYPYDIDTEQWMPPWSYASQYVYSGETSPGNYVLMGATATKALQMSDITVDPDYTDNGATYAPIIRTNLFSVVPDFGKRFSYIATGIYNEPTRTGVPRYVCVVNNGQTLLDVMALTDEDPAQGIYSSLLQNVVTPESAFIRTQGKFLTHNIYAMNKPTCRWVSIQIKLANADQADNLYEIFLAYENYR